MKQFKLFTVFFMLSMALTITSCNDENDEPENIQTPMSISEGIVGDWLLASSDDQEWTVYEFKQSQRMDSKWFVNNALVSGDGSYFTNDEKSSLSGTINDGRGNFIYLNWIAKKIQAYQIDIDIYGGAEGNQFVASNSLYRIVGTQEIEYDSTFDPDYRKFTGTNECSGFISMDESIVTVNSSGTIECVGVGSTYVIFNTPAGHACLKIAVSDKMLTFSENILGTWVTDNKGYIWERDVFGEEGYFYAQWSLEVIYPTSNESAQGTYSINETNKKITVSAKTPYGRRYNVEYRITKINKFSFNTDIYSGGDKTGTFYYQRVLSSLSIKPKVSEQPNYLNLVGSSEISGFSSHDEKIATVDKTTGLITGVSKGITYIDVITNNGTGVIEVTIEGGAIPYEFQDCLGKPTSKVKEMLGAPYYEDETTILYKNLTNTIDMVGARIDSFSGLIKGITITYNSNVKTDDVTSILDATFIPFASQTTATFKAYMDTYERADASIGVTWDIPTKTLTYVNLAKDLFTDYSVLINMTRDQVINKMGKDPDSANDQSQSFFFFDNKGIKIVSAYYTDFVNNYDKVHSVVTMLDDTLSVEQITTYLKKKYPYYPEYSTDEELVFVPEGHAMEIYYRPKDKMIMYISTAKSSDSSAGNMTKAAAVANQLKANMRTE